VGDRSEVRVRSNMGSSESLDLETIPTAVVDLTGSAIGRHLMVPHISGKKTWEGFFGAIVFALLCSLALFKLMPGHLPALTWTHATVLGLLLGFAAVLGDLAESIIKRSTDVKDSGNLLPGIGGALDLLDSLLFTAPLLFFYLRLVIRVS
jgi:phosphatidate cytidylyltransferase